MLNHLIILVIADVFRMYDVKVRENNRSHAKKELQILRDRRKLTMFGYTYLVVGID